MNRYGSIPKKLLGAQTQCAHTSVATTVGPGLPADLDGSGCPSESADIPRRVVPAPSLAEDSHRLPIVAAKQEKSGVGSEAQRDEGGEAIA
jgi:hypothetical protein